MASPQAAQHWSARNYALMLDVDADYSTAAVVTTGILDMSLYEGIVVLAMSSALTGAGITLLEIIGCEDSDGTGNITQIVTSGVVAADAVGDWVRAEATAEQMRQESEENGYDLRYMAPRLTNANAADEVVMCVIGYGYKYGPSLNLTPATTIS